MKENPAGNFSSFITGAIIGGIIGVLFAPQEGNKTRQALKSKAEDAIKEAQTSSENLKDQAEDKVKDLKSQVSDKAKSVKDEVEHEVKNLKRSSSVRRMKK